MQAQMFSVYRLLGIDAGSRWRGQLSANGSGRMRAQCEVANLEFFELC
jgi:hypothetical protein